MKKFDVIIVGAGPAGIISAKVLKENNINFCIIEKNKFPREKLCGGGLTNKTISLLKELNFSLKNLNKISSNEVRLCNKNLDTKLILNNKIIMVDRKEFDFHNLKELKGINIFQEENIIDIKENTIYTNKEKYLFKYIIFADWVNGYSRRLIKGRKFGFCVEYNSSLKTDKTIIDFSIIPSGYGWIFPKNNHTTIGLGNFNDKKFDYKNLLSSFAKKYNFDIDSSKIKGFHIPIFSKKIYKQSVIDNKYILVGDAASLVDQITGEGIYYALESGRLASESIISSIKYNTDLKKTYYKKTKKIYRTLQKRKILSKFFYSRYTNILIKIALSNKYFIKKINNIFG